MVSELKEKVIPLVVKKGASNQKFRIPFKNTGPQDLELDFSFSRQSAVVVGPPQLKKHNSENDKQQPVTQSPLEFVSMPSNVKIPANGSAILNIVAKLKNSYQLQSISRAEEAKASSRPEKYNHLLIAKVKDTQIMFHFIIEASVIESNGNANAMS